MNIKIAVSFVAMSLGFSNPIFSQKIKLPFPRLFYLVFSDDAFEYLGYESEIKSDKELAPDAYNLEIDLCVGGKLEMCEMCDRFESVRDPHASHIMVARAQYRLGQLLENRGKLEEAKKCYRLAVGRDYTAAQYFVRHVLEKAGEVEETCGYLGLLVGEDVITELECILAQRGESSKVEECYRLAANQSNDTRMAATAGRALLRLISKKNQAGNSSSS